MGDQLKTLPPGVKGIYREYFDYHNKYTSKYGSNVIVLMCVGAFYEIYQYDLPELKIGMCLKMRKAIDDSTGVEFAVYMMNKKKEHSLSNPYRLGFGVAQLEKWKTVLLKLGYILIKVDQSITLKDNKKIVTREVTKVLTLGTDIELVHGSSLKGSGSNISNRIVSIVIDIQKIESKIENSLVVCGYSWIDLITGETLLGETASTEQDCQRHILVLSKLLATNPKEILIYSTEEGTSSKSYYDYLYNRLELYSYNGNILFKNKFNKECMRSSYQLQFLKKIYTSNDVNTMKECTIYLYATSSLILLLEYCADHDEKIIERLNLPKLVINECNKLFISKSTSVQLNLFSNNSLDTNIQHKKINSLMSIIDCTKSILGKRYLLKRIRKPYTKTDKINNCYNIISDIVPKKKFISHIRKLLGTIPDLDLLHRRLVLSKISFNSLNKLTRTYVSITKIYDLINSTDDTDNLKRVIPDKKQWNTFQTYSQMLSDVLCPLKYGPMKIENNYIDSDDPVFTKEISKYKIFESISKAYVDQIQSWEEYYPKLVQFRRKIYEVSGKNAELTFTNNRYYVMITAATANKLKKLSYQVNTKDIGKKKRVYTEETSKFELLASENRLQWQKLSHNIYTILLDTIYRDYLHLFKVLKSFISKIDYFQNGAFIANKYNYCKPKIESSTFSYLYAQQIRHPIVERIIDDEYIPNNIFLGSTSSSIHIGKLSSSTRSIIKKSKGMLLYGCNSSGKSTLTKSIGIAVIMAQTGYYVPASSFIYSPYNNLISRLSGNDNIFTGDSSFVIEMKELNTILKNSDQNTLILGDELCRGTESISATSLTISTLLCLMKRKSTFIFSTHLHKLSNSKFLKESIDKRELSVNHLDVYCDSKGNLKYNRTLTPGKGGSSYGIEVAKSLGLPKDFLEKTYQIRKDILGNKELYSTKRSRYNSNVYMDACVLCGEQFGLETHHIREQKLANDIKYIGHVYKDSKCNLSVLCKLCHLKMSSGWKIEKTGDVYKLLKSFAK